jgi:hypothetical protein
MGHRLRRQSPAGWRARRTFVFRSCVAPPGSLWWLIASRNVPSDNFQAGVSGHVGDTTDIGRGQIHPRRGAFADADFVTSEVNPRRQHFTVRKLNVLPGLSGALQWSGCQTRHGQAPVTKRYDAYLPDQRELATTNGSEGSSFRKLS